jgi:hypothetical protein
VHGEPGGANPPAVDRFRTDAVAGPRQGNPAKSFLQDRQGDPQIEKCRDGHISGNAGRAIKIEDFHKFCSAFCSRDTDKLDKTLKTMGRACAPKRYSAQARITSKKADLMT